MIKIAYVDLLSISGGKRRYVGLYRQDKNPKYFEWVDDAIIWKGSSIDVIKTIRFL